MITVKVLHAKVAFFRTSICYSGSDADKQRIVDVLPSQYREVAEVRIDENLGARVTARALDEAFSSTQNIDKLWVLNENVSCSAGVMRSTSVGDVMQLDGRTYIVASNGFDDVTDLLEPDNEGLDREDYDEIERLLDKDEED